MKKMLRNTIQFLSLTILILCFGLATEAQMKSKKTTKKNTKPPTIATTPAPVEDADANQPQKKNSRDDSAPNSDEQRSPQKKNQNENPPANSKPKAESFDYFYEFTNKEFIVSQIVIEHDENGKGKITFLKKSFDEPVSDPIQLSPATLEKIKTLFQSLNFLDSTEEYQSSKYDYKHLGTSKIRLRQNGKNRAVEYNWTENKDAKALADEYRKIGNQYVWQFDMTVARENQPLEAPGLMEVLDSYLKRSEISDPPQMIPLLKDLSNDERIPLIARNRAAKIIKQIEKQK
jgi:hypothetical protein